MLDSYERDGAKAFNDGILGDEAVSAFRWLERDTQAGFCHDGVKIAFSWTPYLADARLHGSFAPKQHLPNSVPHSTRQTTARSITNTGLDVVSFRQQPPD